MKQLQYFVIKEQILISSNNEKKIDIYVNFIWQMILPHLDLVKEQNDAELEQENNDKKEERNQNLITQFLKTALALNCFDQAYYELNNKLFDYPFIKKSLKFILEEMEDDLDDYENVGFSSEESESSKEQKKSTLLKEVSKRFDPTKTKMKWLIFMKVFSIKKVRDNEKRARNYFEMSIKYMKQTTEGIKEE